jgi:hypothetical protein
MRVKNRLSKVIEVMPVITPGGAEGIRTPDLLRAKEALSQLSYSPLGKDIINNGGYQAQLVSETVIASC